MSQIGIWDNEQLKVEEEEEEGEGKEERGSSVGRGWLWEDTGFSFPFSLLPFQGP